MYSPSTAGRNGETYDLIFDILGKESFSRLRQSLSPNGIYLLASFKAKAILQTLWTAAAHRYVEAGDRRGPVVVTIGDEDGR